VILTSLLLFVISFFVVSFLGYWVHKVFHNPKSLWFYDAHNNHHTIQYPVLDFFSVRYRSAGNSSSFWLFLIVSLPILIALVAFIAYGKLPIVSGIVLLGSLVGWGLLHDYIHDQFHILGSPWKRFAFFRKWREIHFLHHLNNGKNFGIITFWCDRLFGTFENYTKTGENDQ